MRIFRPWVSRLLLLGAGFSAACSGSGSGAGTGGGGSSTTSQGGATPIPGTADGGGTTGTAISTPTAGVPSSGGASASGRDGTRAGGSSGGGGTTNTNTGTTGAGKTTGGSSAGGTTSSAGKSTTGGIATTGGTSAAGGSQGTAGATSTSTVPQGPYKWASVALGGWRIRVRGHCEHARKERLLCANGCRRPLPLGRSLAILDGTHGLRFPRAKRDSSGSKPWPSIHKPRVACTPWWGSITSMGARPPSSARRTTAIPSRSLT